MFLLQVIYEYDRHQQQTHRLDSVILVSCSPLFDSCWPQACGDVYQYHCYLHLCFKQHFQTLLHEQRPPSIKVVYRIQ